MMMAMTNGKANAVGDNDYDNDGDEVMSCLCRVLSSFSPELFRFCPVPVFNSPPPTSCASPTETTFSNRSPFHAAAFIGVA